MTDPLEADVTQIRMEMVEMKGSLKGVCNKVERHDNFLSNNCPKRHEKISEDMQKLELNFTNKLNDTKISLAKTMTTQNIILVIAIGFITYIITNFTH
jgi:hypothetical protein